MSETLTISIRTLTPIWTGDVNGRCSEIKETGVIGSLRWWYEAIKLISATFLFEKSMYSDAISRAYYSMHYSARALLSTRNIFPKTHKGVIAQLGLEFVKEGIIEEYYLKAISTERYVKGLTMG